MVSKAILLAGALFGVSALPAFAQGYFNYPESQGWNQQQMRNWYELTQGSRLAPLSWLNALKNADGTPFFSRTRLEGYGYLYFSDQADSLPIGFVLDRTKRNPDPWLGFNCSACHTAKLKAGTAEVWVHGGQSMADFKSFTTDLVTTLQSVAADEKIFDDFATLVHGGSTDDTRKAVLRKQLDDWIAFRKPINDTAEGSTWGRGRADAVGIILATTAAVVADSTDSKGKRRPFPASNAPVSYPYVWNANQQGRLQHNGVVDNGTNLGPVKVAKIGALIRNWTEALGVFADVKLDSASKKVTSSIRLDNLLLIEQALAELHSPRWPEAFGAIDRARQARGEALYMNHCNECHGKLASDDTTSDLPWIEKREDLKAADRPDGFVFLQPVFDATITPADFEKTHQPSPDFIGTDPGMACNALTHKADSGKLAGEDNQMGILPSFNDGKFADRAVTTDLLRVLIQKDVLEKKTTSLLTIAGNQFAALGEQLQRYAFSDADGGYGGQGAGDDPLSTLRNKLAACAAAAEDARAYAPESPLPVYKSRPLNGIWATAPYLHNGAVPTLYDLLLPQAERPKTFGYFDGEMDLAKVGLKDASSNPAAFIFETYDEDGVVRTGNWNGGHEYGATLSHDQRLDLVEYLKGL